MVTPVWEIAVHLGVARYVYDGVFLCCPFFQQDVWDEILDLMTQFLRVFLPTLLDEGTFQAVHRNVIVTGATNRRQCGVVSASCAC